MVLVVRMASAPATFRHLFAGTNALVSKDISRGLTSLTVSGNVNGGNVLESCRPSLPVQHGTAAKTLKYWSGVQCQTRGLFGQCRTGGLAVTKQALKPGLSNPFWVPSAGYCDYPPNTVFDLEFRNGILPGNAIIVKGIPHPDCKQFTVSLDCGRQDVSTVPFSLTAYFKDRPEANNIVLNNRRNGIINRKNEKKLTTFPFQHGKEFKMKITHDKNHFKVAVNDQDLDFIVHDLQVFERLNFARVFGDVRVTTVSYIPGS
ncbi:galectin-3-like [Physella acuta]|uniref:galectin-3-like n=1 Tax=Physella acuta TaxID=109671 RepID=UPI0027DEA603|nr:galectin-3-like [Physella acuta]